MGHSGALSSLGQPTYDTTPATVSDLQAAVDFAASVGNTYRGTTANMNALTGTQLAEGRLFLNTDDGLIYRRTGSAWVQYVGAGGAGSYANLAAFPSSPTQGQRALALDTGILYRYFALYNASTNPTGRKTAGWKPWETAVPVANTAGMVNYNSAAGDNLTNKWSAQAGRITMEGTFTIVSGGGMTGNLGVNLPFAAADKYATPSSNNYPLGTGMYLVPLTAAYALIVMISAQTARADIVAQNASATYLTTSATSGSVPVSQVANNIVSWLFSYDPA